MAEGGGGRSALGTPSTVILLRLLLDPYSPSFSSILRRRRSLRFTREHLGDSCGCSVAYLPCSPSFSKCFQEGLADTAPLPFSG